MVITKWSLTGGESLMTSGPVAMRELTTPCKRKNTIQPKERIRYGTMAPKVMSLTLTALIMNLHRTLRE